MDKVKTKFKASYKRERMVDNCKLQKKRLIKHFNKKALYLLLKKII